MNCHSREAFDFRAERGKNLSQVGICGIMHRNLRCNENYPLSVFLHNGEVAELQVSLIWAMDDGTCGFDILDASVNWAAFVKGLRSLNF